jgi:hypothetical protein
MPSADTPGVPPMQVPRPDEDLAATQIALGGGAITMAPADYAAAGRIFKWLLGQIQLAQLNISDEGGLGMLKR